MPPTQENPVVARKLLNPELHTKVAMTLLAEGQLGEAMVMFCDLARKHPGEQLLYLHCSAILHFLGKTEEARRSLITGVAAKAYEVKSNKDKTRTKARVLRFRGVQNAYFSLAKGSDGLKIRLSGGGFACTYLLNPEWFPSINYLVLDGNLDKEMELPPFDVIINSIADTDVERQSLLAVSRFIRANPGYPVINDPDKVLATSRDNNYRRFGNLDGIIFPKTLRMKGGDYSIEELKAYFRDKGLSLPVLVRETGTQTGKSFEMSRTLDDVQKRLRGEAPLDYYIIQYVEDLYRGQYFRKMRFFFVDGKLYPVILHIDNVWMVHGTNRKDVMLQNAWMMDEEKAFLEGPRAYLGDDIYERIESLYDKVQLDFFGIDFTVTDKGEVLIYEMNPAMRHKLDHAKTFPYMMPYLQNVTNAFNAMVEKRAKMKSAS